LVKVTINPSSPDGFLLFVPPPETVNNGIPGGLGCFACRTDCSLQKSLTVLDKLRNILTQQAHKVVRFKTRWSISRLCFFWIKCRAYEVSHILGATRSNRRDRYYRARETKMQQHSLIEAVYPEDIAPTGNLDHKTIAYTTFGKPPLSQVEDSSLGAFFIHSIGALI
jgi:hypothetical protein